MLSIYLTNLAAYRNYFQNIATKHKEIDGFKWGDEDVLANDNRSDMPASFLWTQPYEKFPFSDPDSDNITKRKKARVAFMKAIESNAAFSTIDAAYDAAEAIVEQIMAKILVDKRGAQVGADYVMLATRIASWSAGPVHYTFGSTPYVGYELEMDFHDPANMQYDATKWDP